MVVPMVGTRVEKTDDFRLVGEQVSEVGTFVAVANRTGKREVFGAREAAMFERDNVVDFKGKTGHVGG